jgi:hypothetical protein
MESLIVKGFLREKFETVSRITANGASFKSREFVLEIGELYSEFPKFQMSQHNCSLLDGYILGDFVEVRFTLKGRKWQDKWLTNLNCYSISIVQRASNETVVDSTARAEKVETVPSHSPDNNESANAVPVSTTGEPLPF